MGNSTVRRINEAMEKECCVYQDILDVSRSKKEAIINGKISDLEKLLKIEQNLLIKAGRLSSERESLAEQLAEEKGISRENISISRIIDVIEEEEATSIENTRGRFLGILNELDGTNRLNSSLVEHSLEYINFSINLLNSVASAGECYDKSGEAKESKGRSYLDLKL